MKRKGITRKFKIAILIFFVISVPLGIIYTINKFSNKNEYNEQKEDSKEQITLGQYVLVTEEKILYQLKNEKFLKSGTVKKNVTLELETTDSEYYKVKNFTGDYYVKSEDLINVDETPKYDDRYKKYIVFNLNVETNKETVFYDESDNIVYAFNTGYSLPIIIKQEDKYGVEFDNRILYIKSDDATMVEKNNTTLKNINGIGVLNYHFFYDNDVEGERQKCNQSICASKEQFKMHLDYIKENNFFTPTMKELEMYIDGNIQLPKSVVITIDDGWRAELGIKMLTEYELNATIFLVTSWYTGNDFRTDYVEVHSHSHNMHNPGDCPTGQGGGIQCLDEEFIINDLKTSSEKLRNSTVFCYPYYEYNNYSIDMLKKAGYTMAFAGWSSRDNNLVKVGSDKYRLPRFVVVNNTSMNSFESFLNSGY